MHATQHSIFSFLLKACLPWLLGLVLSACSENHSIETEDSTSANSPSSIQINAHPESVFVVEGSRVTLSVDAEGDNQLTYQWLKDASVLPGATGPTYTIDQVTEQEEARYRVLVSNGQEEVYSKDAIVSINNDATAITIIQQPENRVVTEGMNANFSVSATGGGFLLYQWYKNGVAIDQANAYTLSIENSTALNAGNYSVSISNAQGRVDSHSATLTVLSANTPIMITQQPISTHAYPGDSAYFSVGAVSGENLSYQWRFNGNNIVGANNSNLVIANVGPAQIGDYSVVIASSSAIETSHSAQLEIKDYSNLQLSWAIPTHRENGEILAVEDIGGYVIEYGSNASNLDQQVTIHGAYTTYHTIDGLRTGNLYLRIATMDATGTVGTFSGTLGVRIP